MNSDLITRLESAPCGTRELSDEVLRALGWKLRPWFWEDPRGGRWGDACFPDVPDPARSVDDALGLASDDIDALAALQEALRPTLPSAALRKALACRVCAALLRAKETDHG